MKKIIVVLIALAIIIIIAGFTWWFIRERQSATPISDQNGTQSETGLGSQVFDQVSQNPADKMPEANPFKADVNPYSRAYKNPFAQ